jgi:hypothetical protein
MAALDHRFGRRQNAIHLHAKGIGTTILDVPVRRAQPFKPV